MLLTPEEQLQAMRRNTVDFLPEEEVLAKLRTGPASAR